MANTHIIEEAKVSDLDQIRDIYAHYVKNTTASLEEKEPTKDEMLEIYSFIMGKNLPFYIARKNGKVIGFSYAQPYRKRSAYRYTVEESTYVDKDHLRNGVGSDLLTAVMNKCREIGYKQMIANVVYSGNEESVEFHESMGFTERGRLINVGFKFNEWLDTVLFQKAL